MAAQHLLMPTGIVRCHREQKILPAALRPSAPLPSLAFLAAKSTGHSEMTWTASLNLTIPLMHHGHTAYAYHVHQTVPSLTLTCSQKCVAFISEAPMHKSGALFDSGPLYCRCRMVVLQDFSALLQPIRL